MKDVVGFLPPDAVAWLRFADGDTRFPVRPIPAGDFLIGSGADCDLRLGDGILPPLHSVLRATETEASWTRLVRSPELFVNGDSVRQVQLHDGDLVEIGPFRLVFRFAAQQSEAAIQALLSADAGLRNPTNAAAELLPQQLMEALEKELQQLQEWERSAQQGLTELVSSINQLASQMDSVRTAHPSAAVDLDDFHGDRESIQQLLRIHADRIESISEVLEHLVRQQGTMTEVLHSLTDRLAQLSVKSTGLRRAS